MLNKLKKKLASTNYTIKDSKEEQRHLFINKILAISAMEREMLEIV